MDIRPETCTAGSQLDIFPENLPTHGHSANDWKIITCLRILSTVRLQASYKSIFLFLVSASGTVAPNKAIGCSTARFELRTTIQTNIFIPAGRREVSSSQSLAANNFNHPR